MIRLLAQRQKVVGQFVFAIALVLLPLVTLSQDLVEFQNGQVADADDLNENLQLLVDEISELKGRAAALEIENCVTVSDLGDGVLIGDQENQFNISDQITISAWVRRVGDCPVDGRCEIVSLEQTNWGSPESWSSGIALFNEPLEGGPERLLTLRYKYAGGRQTRVFGYSEDLKIGRWTHVAAVVNTNSVHLFVNGKALNEITAQSYVDGVWEELNFPQGPIEFDGNTLDHSNSWIGRGFPNGLSRSIQNVFVGNLARIGIWATALTTNEIRQLYANTLNIGASEPAGFWPLNQASGDVVLDLSKSANNGLLEGDATWSENCRSSGVSNF